VYLKERSPQVHLPSCVCPQLIGDNLAEMLVKDRHIQYTISMSVSGSIGDGCYAELNLYYGV